MKRIVEFHSGDLRLEGVFHPPSHRDMAPMVVVLHPHPRYGGTQENYVVARLCEALSDAGMGALRFNFRGVERSEGQYGRGVDEELDVHAAVAFARSVVEARRGPVGLVGYSFGAKVALAAGQRTEAVGAICAVSLPEFVVDDRIYVPSSTPKLLISGSEDHLMRRERLEEIARRLDGPVDLDIIEGADHFWAEDHHLATTVVEYLEHELSAVLA